MSEVFKPVFLRGKKTILRPISREDLPMITKWVNDEDVRKFVQHAFPANLEDEQEWLEKMRKGKENGPVVLIEADGAVPIGVMGIHHINWRDRVATTGAMIGEKEFWGKGYGSDAKMSLLHYAFNTLNLRKICSSVISYNERSHRYSLKCGYAEEGRLKEHIYREGKYWDLIQLAVFKDDFFPLWEKYSSPK